MQRRMVHGSGYYGESPVKVTLPPTSNLGRSGAFLDARSSRAGRSRELTCQRAKTVARSVARGFTGAARRLYIRPDRADRTGGERDE